MFSYNFLIVVVPSCAKFLSCAVVLAIALSNSENLVSNKSCYQIGLYIMKILMTIVGTNVAIPTHGNLALVTIQLYLFVVICTIFFVSNVLK